MLVREGCSCPATIEAEANDKFTMVDLLERWRREHHHEIPQQVDGFSVGKLSFLPGWPAEQGLTGFTIIPPELAEEDEAPEHVDDPAAMQ